MKIVRIILAFLLAPGLPFLLYFASGIESMRLLAALGLPIVYFLSLIIGIPAFFLVKYNLRWQRASVCALIGAAVGFFVGNLFASLLFQGSSGLMFLGIGILHGECTGLLFWLIARPGSRITRPTHA